MCERWHPLGQRRGIAEEIATAGGIEAFITASHAHPCEHPEKADMHRWRRGGRTQGALSRR